MWWPGLDGNLRGYSGGMWLDWIVGDTKADTGLRGLIVKDKTGIRWQQISNLRLKKSFFFMEWLQKI